MDFATSIEAVLQASGFEVYFPKQMQADASLMVGPPGVHIAVKDPKLPAPLAARICRAFRDAGIPMSGIQSSDPDFPADKIEITVGQK
jgi:hypothetical protein